MNQIVDLRSDTVTRPTPEMYEAMRLAPLGDDVLGDEPTVAKLEKLAAETMGKEAAVFVPSGTMGNQIALACHCSPGDAILIEQEAHILYYEVGAPAVIAGVVSWTLPSNRGAIEPNDLRGRVLKRSLHTPGTTLLCLENTHNRAGGAVIPLKHMAAYRSIADETGLKIHLDGARVFNASVALGVDVKEIVKHVDTVNFCLSKGLRSPVGSVLCGPIDFIDKARVWRKRLGGGMRQAGILAACGIVSLTTMVERLAEDHNRAKTLALELSSIAGLSIDISTVQTNMVLINTSTPAEVLMDRLKEQNVLVLPTGSHQLRAVLHADVNDSQIETAIAAFKNLAE